MRRKTIAQIFVLNHQFYQKTAKNFDLTRQNSWPGWNRIKPWFKRLKGPITVLDVGCGNGRYGKFLESLNIPIKKYIGLDSNTQLLAIAEKNLTKFKSEFHQVDITKLKRIKIKADIVVMFGVMHHLPSAELRQDIINRYSRVVEANGILIISFWQWLKDPRQKQKIIPWEKTVITGTEPNDFLLDWQQIGIPRYCHHFEREETDNFKELEGFKLILDYEADGKQGILNRYLGWQKKGVS